MRQTLKLFIIYSLWPIYVQATTCFNVNVESQPFDIIIEDFVSKKNSNIEDFQQMILDMNLISLKPMRLPKNIYVRVVGDLERDMFVNAKQIIVGENEAEVPYVQFGIAHEIGHIFATENISKSEFLKLSTKVTKFERKNSILERKLLYLEKKSKNTKGLTVEEYKEHQILIRQIKYNYNMAKNFLDNLSNKEKNIGILGGFYRKSAEEMFSDLFAAVVLNNGEGLYRYLKTRVSSSKGVDSYQDAQIKKNFRRSNATLILERRDRAIELKPHMKYNFLESARTKIWLTYLENQPDTVRKIRLAKLAKAIEDWSKKMEAIADLNSGTPMGNPKEASDLMVRLFRQQLGG